MTKKPDPTMQRVRAYLKQKVPVYLYHNNDAGEWQWSVVVHEGQPSPNDFWLDAFPTKKEAQQYCRQHGLTIRTK